MILLKYTLPHQKLKLSLLQRLNDELAVGCIEEEAVGFAGANLKLGHLNMVLCWRE
jgi:hypothetical protein